VLTVLNIFFLLCAFTGTSGIPYIDNIIMHTDQMSKCY